VAPPLVCLGCQARDSELAYLRGQNAALVDKLLALANPTALAVVRGQMPMGPTGIIRDEKGNEFVEVDGRQVPMAEWQHGQEMLDKMMSGNRG
jgi:hypothetical protein